MEKNRVLWLIDGEYSRKGSAGHGFKIDFLKLKHSIERILQLRIHSSFYYSCFAEGESDLNPFHRSLERPAPHGPAIAMRLTHLKRAVSHCRDCGQREMKKVQKGVDVELALHLVDEGRNFDTIVLFAGDADFAGAVQRVRNAGKRVVIVGFSNTVSREFEAIADQIILLDPIAKFIARSSYPRAFAS